MSGAGRSTQATDDSSNTFATSATFAPHGALMGMTSGSGIVTNNIYNNRLQPTLLSAGFSGQNPVISLCYDFHSGNAINVTSPNTNQNCRFNAYGSGNNGNVFQSINHVDTTRSAAFTYDILNRITQANTINTTSTNCWGENYTIDNWGNLTNVAGVASMGSCWTETLNAAPASTANRLGGYCYDAAGNYLLFGACPSGTFTPTYSYDTENRLSSTAGYNYYYDGDGTRMEKQSGSTGTMYWPGIGGKYLTETDLSGNINEEYIYFNGERLARIDRPSGTVHYYFSDQLGSASVITDPNGVVQEQYYYYPFGGMQSSNGSDTNHYKFTGKERDSESGLDEFGARYYTSSLGRFMIPDWAAKATAVPYAEFGDPQTLNLYAYVRNNPLSKADPDGHGDAGTFCNTQCRYGTPVSDAEIQVHIGILELGSAVATGGATLEALEAGAALKTAIGAITTTGLAVSGSTRIIATASGGKPENVEQGTTAVTTVTTPVGMAVTLGTGGNVKAGAVASDVSSAASMVRKPAEAAKDPAGAALTVNNVVQDVKAGIGAVKSFVSPPPPPLPPPPPPPPTCTNNGQCH